MHWRLLTLFASRSLCLLPSSPSPCVFFYLFPFFLIFLIYFYTYFALSTGLVVVVLVCAAAADIVFSICVSVCGESFVVRFYFLVLQVCVRACVLCKVKVIKLYAQFILHSPQQ